MEGNPPPITRSNFDESSLEIFEGDLEKRMQDLVAWIDKRVKRKQWSNEEITAKFTKRSAQQVLADGDTGFMNPCSDLSLVAWALLRKNGLKPTLITEKLRQRGLGLITLHFALEFSDKDVLYFLEFVQKNQVLLRRGEYTHQKEGVETLQIKKITSNIRFDQNMRSVLEDAQFDASGFHLEDLIRQLQKDNTPQTYTNYDRGLPNKGGLYLDSNIKTG